MSNVYRMRGVLATQATVGATMNSMAPITVNEKPDLETVGFIANGHCYVLSLAAALELAGCLSDAVAAQKAAAEATAVKKPK